MEVAAAAVISASSLIARRWQFKSKGQSEYSFEEQNLISFQVSL